MDTATDYRKEITTHLTGFQAFLERARKRPWLSLLDSA